MDNNIENKLIRSALYKIKDSLLNAINDINEDPRPEYAMPERVEKIYSDICSAYTELDDILDKSDRSKYMEKLDAIEEDIKKAAWDTNRYISANDKIGERLINEYKLKHIMQEDTDIPLNNGIVVHTAEHFLTHLEDDMEDLFNMSELVASVPLRMTKERYSSYIKDGIELITKDMSIEFIAGCMERLKDMYYPIPGDSLKNDFPFIYDKLMLIHEEDMTKLTAEDIEERLGDIDGNLNTLSEFIEVLSIYYNDVNYLRIIATFATDRDFLFDEDMMLKDLYYALCSSIKNKDKSFKDEIEERTCDEIENRFEDSRDLEDEIMHIIDDEQDNEDLPESTRLVMNVNTSILEMYYSELFNSLMHEKTDMDKEQLANSLIEHINDTHIPSEHRKFIRQIFLKHLPCPMSHKEVTEYIAYALDGINDKYVSLVTYGDIFKLTEHEHEDEDEHEHHHHHHHH